MARSQKVPMDPPSSMVESLNFIGCHQQNTKDYMLLHQDVGVPDTVLADLPMAYPRVGAPDNLGRDSSFEGPESGDKIQQV